MKPIPLSVSLLFALTILVAVGVFCRATPRPGRTALVLFGYMALMLALAFGGFYANVALMPLPVLGMVGPAALIIGGLFATRAGRRWLDALDPEPLAYLHTVRVLVEFVLFALAHLGTVPHLMTFEGRNFDILTGLTAPLVAWFGFTRLKLSRGVIVVWNLAGLALLVNIAATGLLSAPTPLQRFAFDQPNVALLHPPFVWLPGVVVPLVLLAHLATLRRLSRRWFAPQTSRHKAVHD